MSDVPAKHLPSELDILNESESDAIWLHSSSLSEVTKPSFCNVKSDDIKGSYYSMFARWKLQSFAVE
jgi:hypothetical protein